MTFSVAVADEYRSKINEGYDYYKNGEYDKAAEQFKDAAILKPDQGLPAYNKGTALYKSNDFENAANEFGAVLNKSDKNIKADAYYDAGNSFFKAGKYDDAIMAYINALKQNSKDKDYKHNLEMALLQKKMQQQQQQQEQNKKDKQNQDKNQQDQQQDKQKQNQDQKQQQQAKQNKEEQQQQQKQQSSQQKEQMTKEQAQNLLARFAEDEKEIQKKLKEVHVRGRSANDW